jgi:hypothetical protein
MLSVDSERPTPDAERGKASVNAHGADAPMRGKAQARVALTEAPRVLARARRRQLTLRPTAEPTSHRAVVSPGQSRIARTPQTRQRRQPRRRCPLRRANASQGACCSAGARPAEQAAGRADRVAPSHRTGACGGREPRGCIPRRGAAWRLRLTRPRQRRRGDVGADLRLPLVALSGSEASPAIGEI